MRRKRTAMREKRKYRMTICFNTREKEMIERAVFVQGLKTGWFTSFASFVRGHALAKAHNLILQWHKRPKVERDKIEAEYESEYREITDDQEVA